MNKIIIILLLTLISCKSKAQYSHYVSPELQIYVDEFVKEANERGINGLWYTRKIDSIVLRHDMNHRYLGLYFINRNVIYINSTYYFHKYLTRKTVFHEIGHSVGLNHIWWSKTRIMSAQEMGIMKNDSLWQIDLDIFFKRRKKQNKKH